MPSVHTAFAWGYWGWGKATPELVRRFDAVEAWRGFGPPLLVDVRASRSVRASGFRGDAFEEVIGDARYRWLQGLGNAAVADGKGSMHLVRPEAARDLLSLVVEAAGENRRVIFFCACQSPWRAAKCHRRLVGTTLLKAAEAAGVPISVQEWPGGEPAPAPVADFEVAPKTLAALQVNRRLWAPLRDQQLSPEALGLPVGSLVALTEGPDKLTIATCPPVLANGAWKLQLLVPPVESETDIGLLARAQAERERLSLEARRV